MKRWMLFGVWRNSYYSGLRWTRVCGDLCADGSSADSCGELRAGSGAGVCVDQRVLGLSRQRLQWVAGVGTASARASALGSGAWEHRGDRYYGTTGVALGFRKRCAMKRWIGYRTAVTVCRRGVSIGTLSQRLPVSSRLRSPLVLGRAVG